MEKMMLAMLNSMGINPDELKKTVQNAMVEFNAMKKTIDAIADKVGVDRDAA